MAAVALTTWLAAACNFAAAPTGSPPTAAHAAPTFTAAAVAASPGYDWPEFNGDAQHSGNNLREGLLTATNVSRLHVLYRVELPSVADGAPAYLHAVNAPTGLTDMLFVTTKAGHILALDAHTGATVWSHQSPAGPCHINNLLFACYTTSSPAVDPNRRYVYSYGLDGQVHKYGAGDGAESLGGGWPELATLKPYDEKGSSALTVATARDGASYLYVTTSGYLGDQGDYQGHLVAINLADGSQRVFNTLCSDRNMHLSDSRAGSGADCGERLSGIWARAGVTYDQGTDKIYLATGNATFDPAHHNWGDSVLALHPDGTGAAGDPLDSYTPTSFAQLQLFDADLGSTAPAALPPLAGSAIQHLAIQGGKDATLRLLNLDDLSGQGGAGHTGGEIFSLAVPMNGQVFTAPAVWTDPKNNTAWVFVANGSGVAGLQLALDGSSGRPRLNVIWQKQAGGTSPIVANGVLYYASNSRLQALDPETGMTLWNTRQVGAIHWESPLVAGGTVYLTDESGGLTAFALLP